MSENETPWRPIGEYDHETMDWVLVQFKERKSGFMPIPMVAERHIDGKWSGRYDDPAEDWYFNECCEAVAFMEIPPLKELFKEPVPKWIFWEERSVPDDVFLERCYKIFSEKYDKDKKIVNVIFANAGFRTWVLNRYHTTMDEKELTMMALMVSIQNEIVREIGWYKPRNNRKEKHDD